MRLILVRHGETEEIVKGIVQGHTKCELNEKGLEQARKVAERLRDEKIDAIFSSDLCRAAGTALEIAKFHKCVVNYAAELRECDMGEFVGRTMGELHKAIADSGMSRAEFRPKGGENYPDGRERVRKFLENLMKTHKGQTVVIVTHSLMIRALLEILLKLPTEDAIKMKPMNTAVSIIEVGKDSNKAHVINCIKHL